MSIFEGTELNGTNNSEKFLFEVVVIFLQLLVTFIQPSSEKQCKRNIENLGSVEYKMNASTLHTVSFVILELLTTITHESAYTKITNVGQI